MDDQRTPEWFAARCGKVTASRIADLMAKTKSGYSASRANYAAQLMIERLTGNVEQGFTNAAMQWGTETEPQARAMYAFNEGIEVQETGFHIHPDIAEAGASPDGFASVEGLVEIKCPNSATHFATLLSKTVDRKYVLQMQWQMACTGRAWCDFVSFDPRLSPAKQYFCTRVLRDDALIAEIESEVRSFLLQMSADLARLETEYPEMKEAA